MESMRVSGHRGGIRRRVGYWALARWGRTGCVRCIL